MGADDRLSGLHFSGAVFDLDGVVTLTATLHMAAWKRLFDEYLTGLAERSGKPFVPFDSGKDYILYVDGKPRYKGVQSFLESRGIHLKCGDPSDSPETETICGLGNRKDRYFRRLVEEKGVEIDESMLSFIHKLKDRGVEVGVASSSKNCVPILKRTGIEDIFEAVVDGVAAEERGLKGKPHPDIFLECARLMDVDPSETMVVEDAISGVQAGENGQFGLVVGIARGNTGSVLRENGADLVLSIPVDIDIRSIDMWFSNREYRRPSALARWKELQAKLGRRSLVVFLDYDGTLTPIVSRPELARIDENMRSVVRHLADVCPTAVVSGRGREDVTGLIGLDNVYYAGSHGFDIQGPNGSHIQYEVDPTLEPEMEEASRQLGADVDGIEGVIVEDKRFSVAVHYRMAGEKNISRVERAVDRVITEHPRLRKAEGKKVFEVRPRIDWDKGKALLWLLEALGLAGSQLMPVYIGDDTTDEDAFRAIRESGIGVLVSEVPRPTEATYSLQDTGEVAEFLTRLTSIAKDRN